MLFTRSILRLSATLFYLSSVRMPIKRYLSARIKIHQDRYLDLIHFHKSVDTCIQCSLNFLITYKL